MSANSARKYKDSLDEDNNDNDGNDMDQRPRRRGRKQCPFSHPQAPAIDYKNPNMLARYISERGKIMPARLTGVSGKKQRELAQAIKRARFLALLPYVGDARRALNDNN